MVGWHHWLNGHEFEQAPGVGDGQGSLVCSVHGVSKSWTQLSNWTELRMIDRWKRIYIFIYIYVLLTLSVLHIDLFAVYVYSFCFSWHEERENLFSCQAQPPFLTKCFIYNGQPGLIWWSMDLFLYHYIPNTNSCQACDSYFLNIPWLDHLSLLAPRVSSLWLVIQPASSLLGNQ